MFFYFVFIYIFEFLTKGAKLWFFCQKRIPQITFFVAHFCQKFKNWLDKPKMLLDCSFKIGCYSCSRLSSNYMSIERYGINAVDNQVHSTPLLPILNAGGSPPKDETTVEYQDSYIPREYLYVALALSGAGMILLLVCCGFTIMYRLRSWVCRFFFSKKKNKDYYWAFLECPQDISDSATLHQQCSWSRHLDIPKACTTKRPKTLTSIP